MKTDNSNNINNLVNSLIHFSFDFDFEEVKKHMKLEEVSEEEIEELGNEKVNEYFKNNTFKIKLSNGELIDSEAIAIHCQQNDIKEPVLFINPDFKYVKWIIEKDFTNHQIINEIKKFLKQNKDLNFEDLQKELMLADVKEKKIVGYINDLPIKTTEFLKEGKFVIQTTFSKESVIKIVYDTIEKLKSEKEIYILSKIKQDKKYFLSYLIFILIMTAIWFLSKNSEYFQNWFNTTILFLLFFIPLVVMRIINHSFIDYVINRNKAIKKYEREYYNKLSIE